MRFRGIKSQRRQRDVACTEQRRQELRAIAQRGRICVARSGEVPGSGLQPAQLDPQLPAGDARRRRRLQCAAKGLARAVVIAPGAQMPGDPEQRAGMFRQRRQDVVVDRARRPGSPRRSAASARAKASSSVIRIS